MSLPVITGVAPRWESSLATLVGRSGRAHLQRRCADVAELVGVAAAGLARLAVVSSDFRGLDRSVVEALAEADVLVAALHPPGDETAARTLRRWGLSAVLPADLTDEAFEAAVVGLVDGADEGDEDASQDGAHEQTGADRSRTEIGAHAPAVAPPSTRSVADEASEWLAREGSAADERYQQAEAAPPGGPGQPGRSGAGADDHDSGAALPVEPGQVVVVWGPHGSTGRTTVAVNLASELADPLHPVVLVDADTYGASVAQTLALLDEAPGLAAAARAADQGVLDDAALARLAPEVRPGLRVLTGLPRGDRWPEVRDSALADVLEQCRQVARHVVVDVASPVEQDEELAFDTAAPRRNGATLTALDAADSVLVVGTGDPLGLQRLVRALDALSEVCRAPRHVVVTRVRPGPVGPEPGRRIREALHRFAGADDVVLVPEDREALDAAMLSGGTLAEVRPGSPVRQTLRRLAERVSGREPTAGGPRRSRLRPWRRNA